MSERFAIDVDAGAFVTEVVPDSGADEARIEPGDVIVEIDDAAVESPVDVRDVTLDREPGDTVELEIRRGGESPTVQAQLGRRGDALSR